jgi:hypothetical protein
MRFLSKAKDGGPKSTVTGYWLVELKSLFSIVLLKFEDGSRDEYHDHAFDSVNWVLTGEVEEQFTDSFLNLMYRPSLRPVVTRRTRMHRVMSRGTTWVFSIRGPWSKTWKEYDPKTKSFSTLTHGRKIVHGHVPDLR